MSRTISALIALMVLGTPAIAAGAPRLEPGSELPPLGGTTLSGDPLNLPRDAHGHPAVLVIGFSKASAKTARPWLDGCVALAAKSPGPGVSCYGIRMVAEVPGFFRGSMERAMRSGLPVEWQRRTLLVYNENDAWRERLGVVDAKTAYVIGCDKNGRVRMITVGAYAESELEKMLAGIAEGDP